MKEALEKLKALQDLQNSQAFEQVIEEIEARLSAIEPRLTEIERQLGILAMDSHTTKLKINEIK